jgi:Holliday junction resolvase
LIGDFGEGFVTYVLIRKGFEVACVDHVGADLIAERSPHRIAVSVKTRLYREGTTETRGLVIKHEHLDKLEKFSERFGLEPVFAHAVCIADEKKIHLFMLRVSEIKRNLDEVAHGFRLRFSRTHMEKTKALRFVDYSSWSDELIGCRLFNASSD